MPDTNILIQENGKIRRLEDVELAEKIVKDRKNQDVWFVIDKLLKIWAQTCPEDVEAIKINLSQYRENLNDKEFATTNHGKEQERRFSLAFPRHLLLMIRTQYKPEELPMDRKFFREFAKRYPYFKVAERD